MTAETSRIRRIGRSYYVKISNQFEELNLAVGDEVQVVVTGVNHVRLADDTPTVTDSVDFPTVSYKIVTGMLPNVPLSMEEITDRIKALNEVPDERAVEVLDYLIKSKQVFEASGKYWRKRDYDRPME